MDRLRKAMNKIKNASGDETKEYDTAKKAYYKAKAVYEQAKKLISNTGKSTQKAEAEVDKARFSRDLDDDEKEEIKEKIAKYLNYKASGDEKKDKKAGLMLLRKFEEDAQFAVAMATRAMQKNGSEKNKQRYYDAQTLYQFISQTAGNNSPAK